MSNSDEVDEAWATAKQAKDMYVEAARDRDKAAAELERLGFRRCAVAACNCGGWHQHRPTVIEASLWAQVEALKTERDRLRASRDSWMETARQESTNRDYYRGLVERCGGALGVAARTQDDGGVVPDVLCAKVPELVEALKAERDEARAGLLSVHDALHRECDGKADLPAEIRALRERVRVLDEALREIAVGRRDEDNLHPLGWASSLAGRVVEIAKRALKVKP